MAKVHRYGAALVAILVLVAVWYFYHFLMEVRASCLAHEDTHRSFKEPPPSYILEKEDRPINQEGWDDSKHYPVDKIDNLILRQELHRILYASEKDNPRAAFDKVVALSSLLPPFKNITHMKTPFPDTFRDYIAPMGLPVIFTDMLEGEPLGRWTWEYVRLKWGKTVYENIRQGNFSTRTSKSGKHYVNRVTVTLEDFIDVVTEKRKPGKKEEGLYIAKKRVIPVEALEAEFYYPPFYPGQHKTCYLEPTGWLASPGTFTQGHIDSKDNFVYQIIGFKRWTIFPPQDYKYLYYTKSKGSLEWSAVLNSFNVRPDLEKYPLYRKTSPVTFVMGPGEVLYLPRGWTHTVANVSPNLMINTWRYGPAAITQNWLEENDREIRKRCYETEEEEFIFNPSKTV